MININKLFEKLKENNTDINGAMNRFVDDEELYKSCLNIFLEDKSFGLLEQSLINKEYGQVFQHAHTLKGVAGNLGLNPLYIELCNLVEKLRINECSNLDEIYNKILHEYLKLQDIIKL